MFLSALFCFNLCIRGFLFTSRNQCSFFPINCRASLMVLTPGWLLSRTEDPELLACLVMAQPLHKLLLHLIKELLPFPGPDSRSASYPGLPLLCSFLLPSAPERWEGIFQGHLGLWLCSLDQNHLHGFLSSSYWRLRDPHLPGYESASLPRLGDSPIPRWGEKGVPPSWDSLKTLPMPKGPRNEETV